MRTSLRMALAALLMSGMLTGMVTVRAEEEKTVPVTPANDAEFVMMAVSGGMFQVESSRMAKNNASSADVKAAAEMMIKDHEKANTKLTEAAKTAGIELPTTMTAPHLKMLNGLKDAKATEFDAGYIKAQIAAHEEAVALFMGASKSLKDPGLKAFATECLPTLKEHLTHVRKLTTPNQK